MRFYQRRYALGLCWVGLANFLDWLPAGVKVVILDAAGSAAAEELRARRPGIRLVEGEVVDWATALAGMEEKRFIFVSDAAAGRQLQRMAPASMEIVQANGLEGLFAQATAA